MPTEQGYSFQPTAIDAPDLQDQGTNRQATHVGNSSKHDHEIHQTKGNRSRSNDTCRSARNALHIGKIFSWKYRKYNGNDDEFVDLCLAACRDLCFATSERLQYLHNLFHGEALRFYNGNVVGRAHQFPEALQLMKEQLNSASKQQQVKEKLSEFSYVNFFGRTGGNKRKAVKELKDHIGKRISLCPGT